MKQQRLRAIYEIGNIRQQNSGEIDFPLVPGQNGDFWARHEEKFVTCGTIDCHWACRSNHSWRAESLGFYSGRGGRFAAFFFFAYPTF